MASKTPSRTDIQRMLKSELLKYATELKLDQDTDLIDIKKSELLDLVLNKVYPEVSEVEQGSFQDPETQGAPEGETDITENTRKSGRKT